MKLTLFSTSAAYLRILCKDNANGRNTKRLQRMNFHRTAKKDGELLVRTGFSAYICNPPTHWVLSDSIIIGKKNRYETST